MILGLVFSVIGCSLLAIDALILQDKEVGQNIAVIMIFAPMMLHMVGHNLLIPMTLRYALEDYAKVTGTAGSVFGAIYYVLIAAVTFLVSKLHSDTIGNFALLFLVLSVSSAAAFYYILILYKKKLT
ncbi:putative membrane protein [Rickettsia bellii str. RML An4]|uniref:Putative membrane protein n=2 Tax=Rickettsia bellii TaxID=33990 RepID=A0A0F3QEK2_RICBE|nr:putative membrane protein [Rickettsia bellii str. RML An4]